MVHAYHAAYPLAGLSSRVRPWPDHGQLEQKQDLWFDADVKNLRARRVMMWSACKEKEVVLVVSVVQVEQVCRAETIVISSPCPRLAPRQASFNTVDQALNGTNEQRSIVR